MCRPKSVAKSGTQMLMMTKAAELQWDLLKCRQVLYCGKKTPKRRLLGSLRKRTRGLHLGKITVKAIVMPKTLDWIIAATLKSSKAESSPGRNLTNKWAALRLLALKTTRQSTLVSRKITKTWAISADLKTIRLIITNRARSSPARRKI